MITVTIEKVTEQAARTCHDHPSYPRTVSFIRIPFHFINPSIPTFPCGRQYIRNVRETRTDIAEHTGAEVIEMDLLRQVSILAVIPAIAVTDISG